MAKRLGISRNYVSMLEGGKKQASEQLKRSFEMLALSPLRQGSFHQSTSVSVRENDVDIAASPGRAALRAARERRALDYPELAKITRLKAAYLRDLEEGGATITEATAARLAGVLGIPVADLLGGSESTNIIDLSGRTGAVGSAPHVTLPPGKSASYAPRLSNTQAGALQAWTDDLYEYEGVLVMNLPPKSRAFALTVRGDSMEPKLVAGDDVIVLWGVEPRNGQIVVACGLDGDVMVKLYSSPAPDRVILTSYNPLHPPIELRRAELRWIFPVHSLSRQIL